VIVMENRENWSKTLSFEKLSLYIDGELSQNEMFHVEQSMENSPDLRAQYDNLVAIKQALKDLPDKDLPIGLHNKIMDAVKAFKTDEEVKINDSLIAVRAAKAAKEAKSQAKSQAKNKRNIRNIPKGIVRSFGAAAAVVLAALIYFVIDIDLGPARLTESAAPMGQSNLVQYAYDSPYGESSADSAEESGVATDEIRSSRSIFGFSPEPAASSPFAAPGAGLWDIAQSVPAADSGQEQQATLTRGINLWGNRLVEGDDADIAADAGGFAAPEALPAPFRLADPPYTVLTSDAHINSTTMLVDNIPEALAVVEGILAEGLPVNILNIEHQILGNVINIYVYAGGSREEIDTAMQTFLHTVSGRIPTNAHSGNPITIHLITNE
jgi:negative regulator of sigma E activity